MRSAARQLRRGVIIAVTAVSAVAPSGAPAATLDAAPPTICPRHGEPLVAVDFGHWGGPIIEGCGRNPPSGFALLHDAGFVTSGDSADGPAFICRIGDRIFHDGAQYPTPSEDSCVRTPSSSAYWAFWVAAAGQNRWSYSPLGADGDVPKPGEVELWTYGATNVAGTSGSGVPTVTPSMLRGTARRAPGTTVPILKAQPTTQPGSSGSPASFIVGIAVGILLFAAAGWAVWRRRRYQ